MNILLIGSSGQLGLEFLSIDGVSKLNIQSPNSNQLDITSQSNLDYFFNMSKPDIVLNFSAYTDVEKAESDSVKANNINNLSLEPIVKLCNDLNSLLIHISTDYVFGGAGKGPYKDSSMTSPINSYGRSKEAGEKIIIEDSKNAIIIRTASLYGLYRKNFFKKFISKLQNDKTIDTISDHSISITYSYDLALFIYNLIIDYTKKSKKNFYKGVNILHIVNKGYTNWFEIGKVIADELNKNTIESGIFSVNEISSNDWVSLASRPNDSRLILSNINHLFDMPNWEVSLRKACKKILENSKHD